MDGVGRLSILLNRSAIVRNYMMKLAIRHPVAQKSVDWLVKTIDRCPKIRNLEMTLYVCCHCNVSTTEWADIVKSLKQLRGIESLSLRIEGVKCAFARNRLKGVPTDEEAIRQQVTKPKTEKSKVTSHVVRQREQPNGSADDDEWFECDQARHS